MQTNKGDRRNHLQHLVCVDAFLGKREAGGHPGGKSPVSGSVPVEGAVTVTEGCAPRTLTRRHQGQGAESPRKS